MKCYSVNCEPLWKYNCDFGAFAGDWPEGVVCLKLHPIQANSCDAISQGAHVTAENKTIHVPALTAAVFVELLES